MQARQSRHDNIIYYKESENVYTPAQSHQYQRPDESRLIYSPFQPHQQKVTDEAYDTKSRYVYSSIEPHQLQNDGAGHTSEFRTTHSLSQSHLQSPSNAQVSPGSGRKRYEQRERSFYLEPQPKNISVQHGLVEEQTDMSLTANVSYLFFEDDYCSKSCEPP